MGDAFKNHVFPKYEKSRAMKPQMKGLEDPTLNSFSLLDLSALMKPELKDQMFEDEFIRSFLNAAKVLAAAGRTAIDRPSMYVILNHSYAIPVLFLTRHCMELAIKRAIRKCGREPKGNHGLSGLWNSLLSRFPEQRGREDRQVIKNMGAFVNSIADIDERICASDSLMMRTVGFSIWQAHESELESSEDFERVHIARTIELLVEQSEAIQQALASDKLMIVGARYQLDSGKVEVLSF